ncbi:MAG: glycine--tRNA ligase subunit beta [Nitrospirota bacterium]|jgi:glycyl-tRNA synthetase beta chain
MPDNRPVLLEIGSEEIPARFLPGALASLKELAERTFAEYGIGLSGVLSYATPRRLAVVVQGVPPRQEDRVREVFGPPARAAFAEDGSPTKAALGFARSQGVEPSSLVVKHKDKGEYVAAVIEEKGRAVRELLPEALKRIVLSLHFPKSMRWGQGTMRFVRPVHWLLALYGEDTVSFEIDGIRSGNTTRGHRFLSPGEVAITHPDAYPGTLEENRVVVDLPARIERIAQGAGELARSVQGSPVMDEELLSIVACLVEYPFPVVAGFERKYLELPDELLVAVMEGHQKYFPVAGPEGSLLNHFIVVSNTRAENADTVRKGAERVIKARFDDARFYFEEDRKRTLQSRVEDLKQVTFHERLGSVHRKTMRLAAAARGIAGRLFPGKEEQAARAATLAKTDLITGVVREFPELQGVMGSYYAVHDGEDDEVARALREQYLPAFSGDRVPGTEVGVCVSLADRMDNVAAFFSIGITPTGSEDPFALRRQALGVIAILTERGLDVSVEDLLELSLQALGHVEDGQRVREDVLRFFEQRMEALLQGKGHEYDLVQSVLGLSTRVSPGNLYGRLHALTEVRSEPWFDDFLTAAKRVRNITAPVGALPPVREALFQADEERALAAALETVSELVLAATGRGDYRSALRALEGLVAPINTFFDRVLVMEKDESLKQNRLALLRGIWTLLSTIADVSHLKERA